MAKAKKPATPKSNAKGNSLSKKEMDIIQLPTAETMKKYNMGKQAVYDKRYALNKKIKDAGINIETMATSTPTTTTTASTESATSKTAKKSTGKRGRPKKAASTKASAKSSTPAVTGKKRGPKPKSSTAATTAPAASSSASQPVEINFGTFSVRLNGVPKKVSVNPTTNAIDIEI